ncbi:hypothetical protein FRC19_001939 [Serendipita sp. 401]|nr:hypothetical protein FRC19_001939 [Serendipita sp. 401]
MALTATDFVDTCAAFADKYSNLTQSRWGQEIHRSGYLGWTWTPHPLWPAFGYLSRTAPVSFVARSMDATSEVISEQEDDLEDVLPSSVSMPLFDSKPTLSATQYIVYSPSFQVPAFYFLVSDASGTPLPLENMIQTSLFRPSSLASTTIHETHIDLPQSQASQEAANFPLLSQGDHPVLGIPCFYLHPCETQKAVEELLSARQMESNEDQTLGKEAWIETWLLVLGNVFNLEN